MSSVSVFSSRRLPDEIREGYQHGLNLIAINSNTIKLVYDVNFNLVVEINEILNKVNAEIIKDVSAITNSVFYDVYLRKNGAILTLELVLCTALPRDTTPPSSEYVLVGSLFRSSLGELHIDSLNNPKPNIIPSRTQLVATPMNSTVGLYTYWWAIKYCQIPIFRPSYIEYDFDAHCLFTGHGAALQLRHDVELMTNWDPAPPGGQVGEIRDLGGQVYSAQQDITYASATNAIPLMGYHTVENVFAPQIVQRMFAVRFWTCTVTPMPDNNFNCIYKVTPM